MKYIYQNKILIFILIFIYLFKDLFVPYYQKYIVDLFLVRFNRSSISDLLFFLFAIIFLIILYKKLKIRFFLKNDYLLYSCTLILIYSIIRYRFSHQLLGFYYFEKVKYFDFLYLIGIIPIILTFGFWFHAKEKKVMKSDFHDDNPINKPEDDILNRKQKALQVFRLIRGYKSKSSLAIGIVGAWGDGKTSFMNIIENKFEDDDKYIVVHFNSWLNISIDSIITDFFTTVEKKISIHSFDVSKEVKKYGNNVLSVSKNSTTETLLNALKIIPDKSLSDNFANVNDLLNKLDKKVIVFFDDLDRLKPDEVFEVLKLIRNTASFDVFNYVVGYDKSYLIEALKNNNIPFAEKYCEKIFLKEFPLPPITQTQIDGFIKNSILEILPKKKIAIDGLFESYEILIYIDQSSIFTSLKNLRNAKRFINEFKVSIYGLQDDVDISDFILIKLLKFSYYDTYRLLFNKNYYLDNNETGFSGERKYINYKLREKDKKNNISTFGKTFDDSLLKEDLISMKLYTDFDIKIVGNICDKIFNKSTYGNIDSALSIAYGHNYFKYFEDEIAESAFTHAEFQTFMSADFITKQKIINSSYDDDRLIGLLLFIYKINIHQDIASRANYENLIECLFYIANLKSKVKYYKYSGIDFDVLDGFMNNYKNLVVEGFKYKNVDELKLFYKSVFYQKREFYDFETDYVKRLYDRSGSSTSVTVPFNRKEMEDYLCYCFDNNSKLITGIDNKFWHCYRLCIIKDWQQYTANSWSPKAKIIQENKDKLIYNIIPKYFDEFLVHCVYPQSFYGDDENSCKVGLSPDDPKKLFGSYKDFIAYLKSEKLNLQLSKPSEFLDEFLLFATEVSQTNQYIDFNFTYIPVVEKLKRSTRLNME